jgi:hypothetical protein
MDGLMFDREKVNRVLRDYFGLDLTASDAGFEVIERHWDPDHFDTVHAQYTANLATHPNRDEVRKRLYVGDDLIVALEDVGPIPPDLPPEFRQYVPFCTTAEINRVAHPGTAADYLLKLRADAIANNPRFTRVFTKLYREKPDSWSLSGYFPDYFFSEYVESLREENADRCRDITAGFEFLQEANGRCIRTPFGLVITVSESLRHFLYYMNVFQAADLFGLDWADRWSAFMIAMRTMHQTETLDFELDPRGELPPEVHSYCAGVTSHQISFVIGHEYAHVLLGHLDGLEAEYHAMERVGIAPPDEYFSPSQRQEFEADLHAITRADYPPVIAGAVWKAAMIMFAYLDLYYAVRDYMAPPARARSHPSPLQRLWELKKHVPAELQEDMFTDDQLNQLLREMQDFKQLVLTDFLPFNIDQMEMYGSRYLPSYRKIALYDRFDF